jgi:hypothetical protein
MELVFIIENITTPKLIIFLQQDYSKNK